MPMATLYRTLRAERPVSRRRTFDYIDIDQIVLRVLPPVKAVGAKVADAGAGLTDPAHLVGVVCIEQEHDRQGDPLV